MTARAYHPDHRSTRAPRLTGRAGHFAVPSLRGSLTTPRVIAALAFAVVACTPGTAPTATPAADGDASIVGTWKCEPPDGSFRDNVEIRADGTVTITDAEDPATTGELTWTVEGDRLAFQPLDAPPDAPPDMGTIESEDRIVFDTGIACTRAS